MKGIVFTEFLELLEEQHSLDFVDELIDAAQLPGDGAYTSVGTYPCSELVALLQQYSVRCGQSVPELLRGFGRYLFSRFGDLYPEFFHPGADGLGFLQGIDAYIHMEVRKLYPDAELPSFRHQRLGPDELRLEYESTRPLAPLAEGLIQGCLEHFGETATIDVDDRSGGQGTHAVFRISRVPVAT